MIAVAPAVFFVVQGLRIGARKDFKDAKNEAGFDAKTSKGSRAGVRTGWCIAIASEWCLGGPRGRSRIRPTRLRTPQQVLGSCSPRRKSPTLALARSTCSTRRTPANRANNMPNAVAEVAEAAEAAEAAEVAEAAVVAEAAAAVSRRDLAASVKRLVFSQNTSPARAAGLFLYVGWQRWRVGTRLQASELHESRPSAGRPSSCSPTDDIPDLLTPRGQRAPSRTGVRSSSGRTILWQSLARSRNCSA